MTNYTLYNIFFAGYGSEFINFKLIYESI